MSLIFVSLSWLSYGQVGYGPELGIGISTLKFAPPTYPILYTSASVSPVISGKIGGMTDVPLNKNIYFQAGISFSRKGAVKSFSYNHNDSFNESVNQTLYISYFDLPLSVVYKTGMQGKGRFIAGIGATPSYIIGGHYKLQDIGHFNDTLFSFNENDKIVTGSTLSAFDIGVNLSAGYEFPTGLFFRLYGTFGINDIGIQTEIDKNRMWGISGGYILGKGRNINKDPDNLIDKTP